MAKNLIYTLAVLLTAVAVSGGVIMAQQYQAAKSASPSPVLSSSTCPCGNGCDCAANGQPCSCGTNGATCGCGAQNSAIKCHSSE